MQNEIAIDPEWGWNVKAWMVHDLKLSGLSLNIYAIIYGYRRKGWKVIERPWLAALTGSSVEGVRRALKRLQRQGLVKTCTVRDRKGERTAFMVETPPRRQPAPAPAASSPQPRSNPGASAAQQQPRQVPAQPNPTNSQVCPPTKLGATPKKVGGHIKGSLNPSSNSIHPMRGKPREIPRAMPRHAAGWAELNAMKTSSVNRNFLPRADAPYMALLELGYAPGEIAAAWQAHQDGLRAQGREPRYYTALWKFLGGDGGEEPSRARAAMDERRRERVSSQSRADARRRDAREQAAEAVVEQAMRKRPEYLKLIEDRSRLLRESVANPDARAAFDEVNNAISAMRQSVRRAMQQKGGLCHA